MRRQGDQETIRGKEEEKKSRGYYAGKMSRQEDEEMRRQRDVETRKRGDGETKRRG